MSRYVCESTDIDFCELLYVFEPIWIRVDVLLVRTIFSSGRNSSIYLISFWVKTYVPMEFFADVTTVVTSGIFLRHVFEPIGMRDIVPIRPVMAAESLLITFLREISDARTSASVLLGILGLRGLRFRFACQHDFQLFGSKNLRCWLENCIRKLRYVLRKNGFNANLFETLFKQLHKKEHDVSRIS